MWTETQLRERRLPGIPADGPGGGVLLEERKGPGAPAGEPATETVLVSLTAPGGAPGEERGEVGVRPEGVAGTPFGEQALAERLAGIELALNVETDPDKVEGLLRERQGVEVRLTAIGIAARNREAARRAPARAERLTALRAEYGVLVARREELERQLRQAVADAEREAPTEALKALAWQLPAVRRLAGERDDLVAKVTQVEKEIDELERPAGKEAA